MAGHRTAGPTRAAATPCCTRPWPRRRAGSGASAVGLIDVGCSAGLNLNVDRVGIAYDNGQSSATRRRPCSGRLDRGRQARAVRGGTRGRRPRRRGPRPGRRDQHGGRPVAAGLPRRIPSRARGSKRRSPWWTSPLLLAGEPVETSARRVRARACGRPAGRHHDVGVVALPLESRLRFLHRLDEAARRPVAWVSVEGVGVAPSVPTLGDRRASGHSIIGLAVLDIRRCAPRRSAAAGRGGGCWRGWPRSRFRRAASCGRPRPRRRPP